MWEDMHRIDLQGFDVNALLLAAIGSVDDLCLFASKVVYVRVAVNELVHKLSLIGLTLAKDKIKCMGDNVEVGCDIPEAVMMAGGNRVEWVQEITVLGSVVHRTSWERPA